MLNVSRNTDYNLLMETLKDYLPIEGLKPKEWLSNERNICLTDGSGNFALFEDQPEEGRVAGHYYYKTARGRKALELSKVFLSQVFSDKYNIKTIVGLTPVDHLGAKWMNRKLGFKYIDTIDTEAGPHELYFLNKGTMNNE